MWIDFRNKKHVPKLYYEIKVNEEYCRNVTHFRRFVSRDKISHYFDRFICQRLYYDAEIA